MCWPHVFGGLRGAPISYYRALGSAPEAISILCYVERGPGVPQGCGCSAQQFTRATCTDQMAMPTEAWPAQQVYRCGTIWRHSFGPKTSQGTLTQPRANGAMFL